MYHAEDVQINGVEPEKGAVGYWWILCSGYTQEEVITGLQLVRSKPFNHGVASTI